MSANITLSRANFSANNIGRVAIMSELTKKVLSKQTQYSIDSAEAAALDTFLAALTAGGFIGGETPKLSVLMIPALASGHDDLFYNICKLDENGAPTNWMPSLGSSLYVVVTSNGHNIGAYANGSVTQGTEGYGFNLNLGTYFKQNQKMPSFCLFNYLCDTFTTGDRKIAYYDYSANIVHSANACSAGVSNGTQATAGTAMSTTPKGFYGMAYDADSGAIILNNVGNEASSSTPVSGGVTLSAVGKINENFTLLSGNSNPIGATHSSIIGFGTGLTQSELATLKGHCDTLAAALHITI